MNTYPFDRSLRTESDLLDYYVDAIRYRNMHKNESVEVARRVFRRTHPRGMLAFQVSEELDQLRHGFIALEAPGMPEDDEKDPDEYTDHVWQLLLDQVIQVKSRTV